ncbi:BamA/TamA family outer membrane protein [Flavobacterium sangjuense]|uniref:Outer membrane protein assembly factor BamA n=1 Tax=Flavobacterium sangjuense TaxID=2518177 RepID=A0A4P7PTX6_9FLAO|nr:hypothetical protein [Flavobacterium sangjuense]QBZ97682.1 hypothetical protein GS03_01180 [Flavobacterium sangjuense]
MKKILLFFFIIIVSGNISAQEFHLKIIGQNEKETKIVDSIGYVLEHKNAKSVLDENNLFYEKLTKKGFLECQLAENFKLNDSTFCFKYSLGKKINYARIYIGIKSQENIAANYTIKNDTLTIPYEETEPFLNTTLKKLETNGFSMAKVKLVNIQKSKDFLTADLSITTEIKRQVNDIVINGYDKFPEGHKKNLIRLYRNKIFNQKNLDKLYNDFEKFRFVKQTKYPEILFTKDSTKIYVYLEKTKPNTFDGYVGFTNDETKKVIFSGYVDLVLNNILNSGEKLSLYWKSDGQDQKTFNLGVELPYIFKSPLGIKAELNIFKQDSTFQNTKTAINLGYYFNYNTRLYLGYQSTESSDIQNVNSLTLSDFDNSYITTALEYVDFKNDDFLFPEKTSFDLKIGTGKRNTKLISDNQFFGSLFAKHNFYLNQKNIVNIKSQNFYLQSGNYIVNELQRFGGINSIRGFNENSLQGNLFGSILSEYRYVLTSNLYVHSIIDYGYLQDKTSESNENLFGFGFGFGLLSKNGLFNFVYANGSNNNQAIKLSNSIVHISFKANF